jgi:hypothetical protein
MIGQTASDAAVAIHRFVLTDQGRGAVLTAILGRGRNMTRAPERSSERRALAMLADNPDGCTEAIMLARGFTSELITGLALVALATMQTEHMNAGGRVLDVIRIRITNAGRRALAAGP